MEKFEHLTKIVGTLGPSSSSKQMIKELIDSGLDVFRINFSHGNREDLVELIKTIREINPQIAILQDLCGPKIRVGNLENGQVELFDNETCSITTENVLGTNKIIPTSLSNICSEVSKKDRILLDDGKLELRVESIFNGQVHCRVIHGGILKDKKGMNFPDSNLSLSSITEKDILDLKAALKVGIDFVALSFVKDEKDILAVKEIIQNNSKYQVPVIAKIERPEALVNLDAILDNSDGVMIARGDLGVELDIAKVTLLQKEIINRANKKLKYVITATQMLESMTLEKMPTRAEVADVSNAILDGSGALMLSAETASGKFPIESVRMLDRIGGETEEFMRKRHDLWQRKSIVTEKKLHDAIGHAVYDLYEDLNVKAIIAYSPTGGMALYLSKHRPLVPIIVFTESIITCRKMQLIWGVYPILAENLKSKKDLKKEIDKISFLNKGDKYILISGENLGVVGFGNSIEISEVE